MLLLLKINDSWFLIGGFAVSGTRGAKPGTFVTEDIASSALSLGYTDTASSVMSQGHSDTATWVLSPGYLNTIVKLGLECVGGKTRGWAIPTFSQVM